MIYEWLIQDEFFGEKYLTLLEYVAKDKSWLGLIEMLVRVSLITSYALERILI